MINIHFELKTTPNSRGKYVVLLRLTQDRKHKRMKTAVELSRVSDWSKRQEIVKSTAEHASELNDILFKTKADAIKKYGELKGEEPVSAASLKRQLQFEAQQNTLLDFCNERLKELKNARQFGTEKKTQDTVNKLASFLKSKKCEDLLITEFDFAMVDQFRCFLSSLPNNKKAGGSLSSNTIVKHLKVLRAMLNKALAFGLIKTNPMAALTLREEHAPQRHLSDIEFDKLKNAPFAVGSGLDRARDLYVAAYYMAGMRFGDVLMLRWNNLAFDEGAVRLSYIMSKNHKEVNIKIHEDLLPILKKYKAEANGPDDYVFGYLDRAAAYASYKTFKDIQIMPKTEHEKLFNAINSRESLINKQLKQCADMIGIPPFSFHSARRAFVDRANTAGVLCTDLKELLKHSSLSTTERYMREVDTSAQDEAIDRTFSHESKEKEARMLVARLIHIGYLKKDVKRLFDDVSSSAKELR